jgi:polar amino acid transport system substrate-binding protein
MAERVLLYGLDKNVVGFSDDLLFEIGKEENVSIYPVTLDNSSLVTLLDQQGIDGVLSALEPNEELEVNYLFSDPYFTFGPILIVAQGSPYKSIQDMKNKEIGFEAAYVPVLRLKASTECIFRPYDNVNPMLEDLLHGRVDGVIIDAIVAYKFIVGPYRGLIRIAGDPLRPLGFRLIVKKGKSEELVATFNQGLAAIRASGLFTKMLSYWGLFDIYNPEETLKPQATGY